MGPTKQSASKKLPGGAIGSPFGCTSVQINHHTMFWEGSGQVLGPRPSTCMDWHGVFCIFMDLDVFGACQTHRMYESKPLQREPQRVAGAEGAGHPLWRQGGRRPPPFAGACFRTFGVFDKLRRHQDPSKRIKIHAKPSNQNPYASGHTV